MYQWSWLVSHFCSEYFKTLHYVLIKWQNDPKSYCELQIEVFDGWCDLKTKAIQHLDYVNFDNKKFRTPFFLHHKLVLDRCKPRTKYEWYSKTVLTGSFIWKSCKKKLWILEIAMAHYCSVVNILLQCWCIRIEHFGLR